MESVASILIVSDDESVCFSRVFCEEVDGLTENRTSKLETLIQSLLLIDSGELLIGHRIGRERLAIIDKLGSSKRPGPNDPPTNSKVASLSVGRHGIPPVVLHVLLHTLNGKHPHMSATLHTVGKGVVDVLSVALRVGTIAPEHLHRLHHAAVAIAQEVSVDPPVLQPLDHRLVEETRPVVGVAHHAALHAHRRAVLVDHGVQPLQRPSGKHDIVIDVVDVVRRQQQRRQKPEEKRRVPVGHPNVSHPGPGSQQRLVVLELHALKHNDLARLLRAVQQGFELPLQPRPLELGEHNADGVVVGVVRVAGEVPHIVHLLTLFWNEWRRLM